jgi:hypothetical protein
MTSIDAREIELFDLFLQLKEMFAAQCGLEVDLDILVGTLRDSKKVSAFAAMSGCQTETLKRDDFYLVRITGSICCG